MPAKSFSQQTKAFVLAGGVGQRLLPLTESRPKPAVSFGGIFRIIDFTLANCLASGVTSVSLLTQYRHEYLQAYIRATWTAFWRERARTHGALTCLAATNGRGYRGTADAVLRNLSTLRSNNTKHVLVLSGDHVYYMDYRKLIDFHIDNGNDLTIAAAERSVDAAKNFGVLELNVHHRVTGFTEKPEQPQSMQGRPGHARVSMGIYVFKTEVLVDALHDICRKRRGSDFGHDVIPALVTSSQVSAYDFRGYWRDIGSIDSYYRSTMELLDPDPQFNPYIENFWWCPQSVRYGRLLNKEKVEKSLRQHAFANPLGVRSVTSSGVRIAEDAVLENCVLLPAVRIRKGARLRRVIVDEGVEIPERCEIGWNPAHDSKLYTVTPAGVAVVSQAPRPVKPAIVVTFVPAQRKYPQGDEFKLENSPRK